MTNPLDSPPDLASRAKPMKPRIMRLALTLVVLALGVGGWLATLRAASNHWSGVAFTSIAWLLIASAFRGRFAKHERARDFWTGFALFGLIHFLAMPNLSTNELMTGSLVEKIGDWVLGPENQSSYRPGSDLTPFGQSMAAIPVEVNGGSLSFYLSYFRSNTNLFASLVFGVIGGLAARHVRRRSIPTAPRSRLGGCPLAGIGWLYLLSVLIGAAFAILAHPELIHEGWFPTCPGTEAANHAVFNVEILAVLFAAFEARFGNERERAWWVGFALFGGGYLLSLSTSLEAILPTSWINESFPWVYRRFVSESTSPTVQVRGMIWVDEETAMFFRSGLIWVCLATFLPVTWAGTLAARLAAWIWTAWNRPARLANWRVRSSIGRIMVALALIGVVLAIFKNSSRSWVIVEGNVIVALLFYGALKSSLGPQRSRAWWWGFALVGAVDLLVGAKLDYQVYSPELNLSTWPIHGVVARLHRQEFERHHGQRVPELPLFESMSEPQQLIYDSFQNSKPLVLMSLCLPMAWIGATLANWLDRRCRSGEISQEA